MTALIRRLPLSDHQADTVLANPDLGWSEGTLAEALANRDARLRRAAYLRPSPDEIIEANRPQREAPETPDRAGLMIGIGVALFVVMLGLVAADGIARAFDRPDACRALTAAECAAYFQEAR